MLLGGTIGISMAKKRSSEADFQCPICMRQFSQAGMDISGVCKSCAKQQAKHLASSRCWHCGADLPPGGVVCPYCKAGRNTPELVKVLGIIVLIGVVFFGGMAIFVPRDKDATNPSGSDAHAAAPEVGKLPKITVVDPYTHAPDNTVIFRNWKPGLYSINGEMIWTGSRVIDTITYVSKENGVVKDRGDVEVPGNVFKANEPVAISISLGTDCSSNVELEIEVNH